MKTKILSLLFIFAITFISCQSDTSSENPEEVNEIQEARKEKKHDENKWHKPELSKPDSDLGVRLHQANYFQGPLANCDTYMHYDGGEKIMVLDNSPQSYHGEVDVQEIEVNDELNICGTLSVEEDVEINYGGEFNLGGELITNGNVTLNYGSHLVVEGIVIIEGDLVMKKGSILKFRGKKSSIEVLGKTKIHKKAIIEGEFTDVSNKIK